MQLIEIDDARLSETMRRLYRTLQRPGRIMGLVATMMHEAVEDNFAAEGRPKWLGLAPSTLKRRRREGGVGKLLQRSGRLAASVSRWSDETTARVGTNLVYAAIHQFGGQIERHPMSGYVRLRKNASGQIMRQKDHGHLAVFAKDSHKRVKIVKWTRTSGWTIKMPARPFLVLTESDNVDIEVAVAGYLRNLVDR